MEVHNKEEAKNIVVECVGTPIDRKDLIEKCVKYLKLPDEILKDKKPGGILNKNKCLFGLAITELIKVGILILEDNLIKLKDSENSGEIKVEKAKRDIKIEAIIFDILKNQKLGKKELLREVVKKYKETQDEIKDSVVKADAGRLLSTAVKNSKIIKTQDELYALFEEPVSETAAAKNERLLNDIGDEELVDQTVLMLDKWYGDVAGYTVLQSENIDGPDDGGIDGIIKCTDKMNASEKIIIQVKKINRKGKFVPLCEIREFYGVFATEKDATRALFVTNGKYYKDTKNFINKTKYFTLIDGKRWLELAEQCQFELPDRQV